MVGTSDEPSQADSGDSSPTARYRTRYDPDEDDSLTAVVLAAVAAVSDRELFDIEPLYTRVDPDALETIFTPLSTGATRVGTVSFPIHDVVVTITDGEDVLVEPAVNVDVA